MKVSRMMWYAGTVFTTLVMLAASTTAAAQQQAQTAHVRTHVDRSLGLSGTEAKQARRAADRDKKDADKLVKDAD